MLLIFTFGCQISSNEPFTFIFSTLGKLGCIIQTAFCCAGIVPTRDLNSPFPLSCIPNFNVTLMEVKVEPQLKNRLAVLIVFGELRIYVPIKTMFLG